MVDVLDASTETVLKITPRACTLCGGKFIPTDRRQKYCPDCRRKVYSKGKTKMEKDTEHVFGPAEKTAEPDTKRADEEPKTDPAAGREAEAGSEDGLEALRDDAIHHLIRMAEEVYNVRLIRADNLMKCELTVGGKTFGGIYVERSTWKGGRR